MKETRREFLVTTAAGGLLSLALPMKGAAAATPAQATPEAIIPSMARMAVRQAFDSDGNAETIRSLTRNAPRTQVPVAMDAPGHRRIVGWQIAAAATGKGLLVGINGTDPVPDAMLDALTIEVSADAQGISDGTWTRIPFASHKPSGDSRTSGKLMRGQYAAIAAGLPAGSVIRITLVKDQSPAAAVVRLGLFQRPPAGTPDDIVLLAGPSLMSAHTAIAMGTDIAGLMPARDPIIVNMARAGAKALEVYDETVLDGLAAYPDASTLLLDIGGNDITAFRPYTTDARRNDTGHALDRVVMLLEKYPGLKGFLGAVTYRKYRPGKPETARPAVEWNVNPQDGALPYNLAQIFPRMASRLPESWDEQLGIPQIDTYSMALHTEQTSLTADGIHGTPAGYRLYRREYARAYKFRIDGLWTRGYVERAIIAAEAIGTISTDSKARLLACIDQWPKPRAPEQQTRRDALSARLRAVKTGR